MKSSVLKVVIVTIKDKKHQVEVDASIHDDYYVEAATRVVEKYIKDMTFFHKLKITAECYEKTHESDYTKHYQVNMYHVLNNAGLYSIAELLRIKTKNLYRVDLQVEPARANVGES